jgi:hypothetical protein
MRPQYDPEVKKMPFAEQTAKYPNFHATAYYVRKSAHPLPQLDEKVFLYVNAIGPATVTGFFVENGWLGFYAKVHNPTDEWVEDEERREQKAGTAEWRGRYPGVYQPREAMFFPVDLIPRQR